MAHYALLDENNLVVNVITGRDEDDLPEGITDWESYYGDLHGMSCKRTSYNAYKGFRRDPETEELTDVPAFRKNYACVGFAYDADLDAFVPPQPFPSWVFNDYNCVWEPPVAYPDDGNRYFWNEELTTWEIYTPGAVMGDPDFE